MSAGGKKSLYELTNSDTIIKNSDIYEITNEITTQHTNVLNVINIVPYLNTVKNKIEVEPVSIPMQIWNEMKKSSFFIFHKESDFRKHCTTIKNNNHFNNFILCIIMISSVQLVIDTPDLNPDGQISFIIFWLDKTYTLIFCIEMTVKMVALDAF